jgi:hypothetical protein
VRLALADAFELGDAMALLLEAMAANVGLWHESELGVACASRIHSRSDQKAAVTLSGLGGLAQVVAPLREEDDHA